MKKMLLLIIVVLITMLCIAKTLCLTAAEYDANNEINSIDTNQEVTERNRAALKLEKLGLINDVGVWNSSNFVTRRELFEVLYIMRTGESTLMFQPEDENLVDDVTFFLEASLPPFSGWDGTFCDLEIGSYDYCFAYSLYGAGILDGKIQSDSGVREVAFDDYVTYSDALAAIIKMLTTIDFNDPYILASEMNLINSQSRIDVASPKIERQELEGFIPANELAHILYRSLYVPAFGDTVLGTREFRYIDIVRE